MPNTISQNPIGSQNPATDMLDQREVSDDIRFLGTGYAQILTLIENSHYTRDGKTSKKGLISKRAVRNPRYEMYTRSQRPKKVTVTSGTEIESSGLVLATVNGILPESTVFNPRNNTSARIEVITSATKTVKGTSINSFSAQADDVLVITAPATDEGSDTSSVYNGTDDQNYNTVQYSRWSVSITWVKEKVKQLAGGDRLKREEMYILWEAMEELERNWIFSNYSASIATKNTTTGQQTGFTAEFPTNNGLFALAANSQSANNAADIDWMVQQLPEAMGEFTNDNDTYIAFCGNEFLGRIVGEQQNKYEVSTSGLLSEFGIMAKDIVTSGPKISLVKHAAFNHPILKKKMLIFAPADLGYVYIEGHDLKPNNGIQDNKAHYTQNELYSYHGIETKNAGKTITVISDLF